jgi:hypothetical protein
MIRVTQVVTSSVVCMSAAEDISILALKDYATWFSERHWFDGRRLDQCGRVITNA